MKHIDVLDHDRNVIGWLDCWEPEELTVKGRRRLQAAFAACGDGLRRVREATQFQLAVMDIPAGTEPTVEQRQEALGKADPQPPLTEDESDRLMMLQQAALVATIAGWYLEVPVSRETLDNMRPEVYDPIQVAAEPYTQPMLAKMQVSFEVSPPQPAGVEPTPFGPSTG